MVQVDLHFLLANLDDTAVEAVTLFVLQGNDSVLIDVLMVEMTIDAEDLTLQVEHVVRDIVAVSQLLGQRKIERLAGSHRRELTLESIESNAKTSD